MHQTFVLAERVSMTLRIVDMIEKLSAPLRDEKINSAAVSRLAQPCTSARFGLRVSMACVKLGNLGATSLIQLFLFLRLQ